MHASSYSIESPASPHRADRRRPGRWSLSVLVIGLVLLVGGFLTWAAWRDALRNERAAVQQALDERVNQLEAALRDRLFAYEALLHAGAGLFDASEAVNEDEWRAFAERLRSATLYPGLQGFGYAKRTIAADGERSRDHTAVVYLEPQTDRNRAALGFDMMGEPVRREAMERARDFSVAALSGKVTLVQEITRDKQAGFLLYLPVYSQGVTPLTVEERRRALVGFVYCPFRAEDFLEAVLGGLTGDVRFELFDAGQEGAPDLLYANRAVADAAEDLTRSRTLSILGRSWLLRVQPTDAWLHSQRTSDAGRILLVGAAGTLLLAILAWALAVSRQRLARQLYAEQLAAQREWHSAAILANSLDAYVAIDGDDRIVEWNRQAENMFGWTYQEIRGAPLISTIIPPRFRAAHIEAVRTFRNRISHPLVGRRIEMPAMKRDGQEIIVELSILATARGDQPLYAASLRDVTELKRHEAEILALNTSLEQRVARRTEELAEANRELELANEQLESFAQNVSHDLRAPLRTIEGFTRLALEQVGESGDRPLAEIARQTRKMQQIIDDLLKLAFIGRQPVQKRTVNMKEIVDAAVRDLNAHAPQAHVVVADDLGEALADPALLEHALRNLVSNALKFSRTSQAPRVEIGRTLQESETVYFVRDNGVGFRKEQAHELFRAFHRLHDNDAFEGAGVGLTIVKNVIDKHGGRIWAEAEPGRGATFYFTL